MRWCGRPRRTPRRCRRQCRCRPTSRWPAGSRYREPPGLRHDLTVGEQHLRHAGFATHLGNPVPVRTSTPLIGAGGQPGDRFGRRALRPAGPPAVRRAPRRHPIFRKAAATSQPMNPAPTITARLALAACSRRARESSTRRSTRMPARSGSEGIRLGTRPVAMTNSS